MEDNEIVYDDPGSVKDIRKKFGVRTNPEFAQPRGPVLSGRNSRSGSIVQNDSLNSSFSGPSESPKRNSQRYSTEADKIFQGKCCSCSICKRFPDARRDFCYKRITFYNKTKGMNQAIVKENDPWSTFEPCHLFKAHSLLYLRFKGSLKCDNGYH
jgi:hypothetical protein